MKIGGWQTYVDWPKCFAHCMSQMEIAGWQTYVGFQMKIGGWQTYVDWQHFWPTSQTSPLKISGADK